MEPAARTERIYLARIGAADIDERYLAWHRDAELMAYYSGSKREFTRESLVREIEDGARAGNLFVYGVYLADGGQLIGNVKIGPVHPHHGTADLATLIGDREQHGKGLASEAVRLAIGLAFEDHGVRKLSTGMYEQNVASIRAYLRAGFEVEGRLRGQYLVDGEPSDRVLVACFNPAFPRPETGPAPDPRADA